jgi:hypothetical protein
LTVTDTSEVNNSTAHPSPPRRGLYRQRTTLRTIRVSSEAVESLDRMAAERGITFNALVNRMMRKFAEFDIFAEKLDFVTLPRETLRSILESADSKTLERIGHQIGERVPSEISFFFFKELGFPVFLKHLENMASYYKLGAVECARNNRHVVVAFHHDLGINWSLFLSGYLCQAAKNITGVEPTCEASPGLVSLRFKDVAQAELDGYNLVSKAGGAETNVATDP